MATVEEVTKAMAYLSALYPRYRLHKATVKAYYSVLSDLPGEAIVSAAEQLGADSEWFPAAAKIRKLAFKLMQGDEQPMAIEGWKQLQDHWNGKYVEFHSLTQKTIDTMGGLKHLGMTTNKQLPFVKNQFVKVFDALKEREEEQRQLLPSTKEFKALQAGKVDDRIKKLAEKYKK